MLENIRKVLLEELMNYPGEEPVLFPLDEDLLKNILIEKGKFAPILEPVLHKIDFSNINFDDFIARDYNFSKLHGVKINPQTVLGKELTNSVFCGVEFIGSFDKVDIMYSNFTGSKGAKIDSNWRSLKGVNCCDIEFIGNFFDTEIRETNFTGSKGAKINPQNIKGKSLVDVYCADVEFIGPFDDVIINKVSFKGSKGAKINPQAIYNKNMCSLDCADVTFISSFEGVTCINVEFDGSNYNEITNTNDCFRDKIKKLLYSNNKTDN